MAGVETVSPFAASTPTMVHVMEGRSEGRKTWWAGVVALAIGGGAAAPAVAATVPVHLEDSPVAQEMVERAQTLRDQKRIDEATALLAQVVRDYGHRLMRQGDGLYIDASLWVRQQIADDPQLLQAYRRLYGPEAARRLDEAGPNDPEQVREVLRRYFLTPAGLDAGLMLAAIRLERADTDAVRAVLNRLDGHPDLPARRVDFLTLAARAAALSGDDDRVKALSDELRLAPGGAAVERLDRFIAALNPPSEADGSDAIAAAGAGSRAAPDLRSPLWTRDLQEIGEVVVDAAAAARGATVEPLIPVPDGDRIFVNTRTAVVAVERLSGRLVWVHERDDMAGRTRTPTAFRGPNDPRGVAVDGDTLFAVLGGNPMARRVGATIRPQPDAPMLVAIDRESGQPRWELDATDVAERLNAAAFRGTPYVIDGRVYAIVESLTGGSVNLFLVAARAEDGRVLWHRHLAGSRVRGGVGVRGGRQIIRDGARLLVYAGLGVVACVEASTGTMQWVRVFPSDEEFDRRRMYSGASGPVEPAPLMLPSGLAVASGNNDHALVLLDPETGDVRQKLRRADAGEPWHLVRVGRDLVLVGSDVRRLDGETLKPVWREPTSLAAYLGPSGVAISIAGRVLVPTESGRLVDISAETGEVDRFHPMRRAVGLSLAAADGQVVAASNLSLSSFMDWEVADRQLRKAIERSPADPSPALALAYLAVETGRDTVALEAADLAAAALDKRLIAGLPLDGPQADTFTRLLAMAAAPSRASQQTRQALFDRVAILTQSESQEVAYHLTYGAFLTDAGEIAAAIDHYQAVVQSPALARQVFAPEPGVRQQAGLEARHRLAELVERHGREVYAKYDTLAAAQLEALLRGNGDAKALVRLASEFPLSSSTWRALYEAGGRLAEAGDHHAAAATLRRAYHAAAERDDLARVVGRLTAVYQDAGQPDRASAWLRRVLRERPGLQPVHDGSPVDPDAWLAELAKIETAPTELPALAATLGAPVSVAGRIVPVTDERAVERTRTDVLIEHAGRLKLWQSDRGRFAWSVEAPVDGLTVLRQNDEQLLLWSPTAKEVVALDVRTGRSLWPTRSVVAMLSEVGERDRSRPVDAEFGEEALELLDGPRRPARVVRPVIVDPMGRIVEDRAPTPRVLIDASEAVVCVGDLEGRIVALDRYTGEVLWRRWESGARMMHLVVAPDVVAVAVRVGRERAIDTGRLVTMDPITGASDAPPIPLPAAADQLSAFEDTLIVSMADGNTQDARIAAYSRLTREAIWTQPLGERSYIPGRMRVAGDYIAAVDLKGVVHVLDRVDGTPRGRVAVVGLRREGVEQVEQHGRRLHVVSPLAAAAIGGDGAVAWRAAIGPSDRVLYRLLTGRPHAVLITEHAVYEQPGPRVDAQIVRPLEGKHLFELYVLDSVSGRLVRSYRVQPMDGPFEPDRATVLDQAVAFTAGGRTLIFPATEE